MYGIYNAKKTVHALHSRQTLYESLFTGKKTASVLQYEITYFQKQPQCPL